LIFAKLALKSLGLTTVPVQVRPRAPKLGEKFSAKKTEALYQVSHSVSQARLGKYRK